MQYSVLIVDDDVKIAKLLETYFKKEAFITKIVHDGLAALELIRAIKPNIIVLDLMLPSLNGLEICRQIRTENNIPILMLTARDDEIDKLIGLEIGADDYVTKPFSPREVVARAKVILRRTKNVSSTLPVPICVGPILIDTVKHTVSLHGDHVDLTPTEFKLLELLASNPNQVFTRLQLIEQVQDYAFEGYERTIDTHIKNLRRKLEFNPREPKYIQTVYGIGYKLTIDNHD